VVNYEEIEQILKQLLQDLHPVPGTFPPVYTCGDLLISYDRQGQIKITGSILTEPTPSPAEPRWLKLPERWFKRWSGALAIDRVVTVR
jgi:hypothetical protein